MATDNNHINFLGSYTSLDAVWTAHPEGGREGDYLNIRTTEYYWNAVERQWVTTGGGGSQSGTLDQLAAAVVSLQQAVTSLQNAVAGKAGLGIDGRTSSNKATRVTVKWMGAEIDGIQNPGILNGEIWFNEQTSEMMALVNNSIKSLGAPDPGLVYCSQQTGRQYRWTGTAWERVGNDVVNSLESNSTVSALSAYQGYQLNRSITSLTESVSTLTDKVNNSVIGDRAYSRVVIDKMDYTPPTGLADGDTVGQLPGGGYYSTAQPYVPQPSDMDGDWSLRYAPTKKLLYYFYKVTNGETTQVQCTIFAPDPQLIYWDASDPDNERVMRWDAATQDWVDHAAYATYAAMQTALADYATYAAMQTALADKVDIGDVYTKDELDSAFADAASQESVSDAFSAITSALSNDDTSGDPTPIE